MATCPSASPHTDVVVYVLNAGGDGNIQGFRRNPTGILDPIAGSDQPLSQAAPGPAQIEFSPNGRHLVVTEKATNRITFYDVHGQAFAGAPADAPRQADTPFGFEFTPAARSSCPRPPVAPLTRAQSRATSFRGNGHLSCSTDPSSTTETAACWVAITSNGRFAYVTNAGSASVSGYRIAANGHLTLLDADGVTGSTGGGPIDITFDRTSHHMYVLNSGSDTVSIFDVMPDGSLDAMGSVSTPDGAAGLVAY